MINPMPPTNSPRVNASGQRTFCRAVLASLVAIVIGVANSCSTLPRTIFAPPEIPGASYAGKTFEQAVTQELVDGQFVETVVAQKIYPSKKYNDLTSMLLFHCV